MDLRGNVFVVKDISSTATRASHERQTPPNPPGSMIGTEFRIIMTTLKLVGNCPLTHSNGRFLLSYKHLPTILSGLSALWTIFFWVCYASETTFKHTIWPKYNNRPLLAIEESVINDTTLNRATVQGILISLPISLFILPVSLLAETVFSWTQAQLLATFLNGWATFERDLSQCWALSGSLELERRLNLRFCRVRSSTLWIFFHAYLPVILSVGQFVYRSDIYAGDRIYERIFHRINLDIHMMLVDMSADALQLLIFRSIADGYKMVHLHMMDWIRQEKPSAEKIKEWRKLIETIRSQCEVACEYQKPTQVLFASRCLVTMILTLFVLLNLPWSNGLVIKFCIAWLGLVLLLFLRMSLKIYAAEEITKAETVLAKYLASLDVSVSDVATFQQIQFTHNIMYQKPVQIVYGNYIVVNKALIMGIMTQVVTYLIVLMQFSQSK